MELTVLDNLSKRSRELAHLLPPNVRIIYSKKNSGYTGGANLGLELWRSKEANAAYGVICSHDLHVEPDTFRKMLNVLEMHPEFGIVGPALWEHEPKGPYPDSLPLRSVAWVSGCCLMLRRSAVEGISFDESFASYVEDVDFCLRVSDTGHQIGRVNGAVAWGFGSVSPRAGQSVKANVVRLHAKRNGRMRGVLAVVQLASDWMQMPVGRPRPLETTIPPSRIPRTGALECFRAVTTVCRPSFWMDRPNWQSQSVS